MADYDFRALNDKEFEVLCADALGSMRGVRFERFKPGRDAGVDGRYFSSSCDEEILQCKHWPSSPLEKLVRYMEKVELKKLSKLRPTRYWLAISHELSRTDKKKIQEAMFPYILSPSDILGREDLNDILSKFEDIERRHYKLWLSTTNVLQHLLNKAVHDRSAFVGEEIAHNAKLYVETDNHNRALQKMEKVGTVIITGEAGIGKTTLADQLVLGCLSDDFELIAIAEEISEAESTYDMSKKQVFYFDDFLGRNYLEALRGHESSQIVQFIRRVQRDKTKRFILTSRTTILNQGKLISDKFEIGNISRAEYEITIKSLSQMDKARILYNHIWHSGIPADFIDILYVDKNYRKVITHRNYNPRLISFITDADRLEHLTASEYWAYVVDTLDNPVSVWENPFSAQLDDFGRAATLLVALHGRAMEEGELAESFNRFTARPENSSMQGRKDFLSTIRHLSGSMLDRISKGTTASKASFNLFNPSIGDYIFRRYSRDIPSLKSAFLCLRSWSSVGTILSLRSNKFISQSVELEILSAILDSAVELEFVGYLPEYVAQVTLSLCKSSDTWISSDGRAAIVLAYLVGSECPLNITPVAKLFELAIDSDVMRVEDGLEFVTKACGKQPDSDELYALARIARASAHLGYEMSTDELGTAALAYLVEAVHEEFDDGDVFEDVGYEDYDGAERNLRSLIVEKLDELGIDIDNIDDIVDAYDLVTRHEYFFDRDPEPQRDVVKTVVPAVAFDEIDDLFERI